jgi:AcrR family transcriptional regulator
MAESATTSEQRRRATSYRISVRAQQLTDQHGLDGWTMEDLAEATGVSRRTLFNYYPGKIDAVLGVSPELSAEAVEGFRSRGATSDLVRDLRALGAELLAAEDLSREDIERSRRILLDTPRLLAAAHDRFYALSAQIVELVRDREGAAFDANRAQVAVRLLAALFDAALENFLNDPDERPLTDAYDDVLRTARQLLA